MKPETNTDMEEIQSARSDKEKTMLLQKFGMIEPKLTEAEKAWVYFEEYPASWEQVNFLRLEAPWTS
jgi:hypothetical protein